jgi:hypothetical protein
MQEASEVGIFRRSGQPGLLLALAALAVVVLVVLLSL